VRIVWFSWKDRGHPLAGGAEVVADQLATRLAKGGHQVTLVAGGFPGAQLELSRGGYRIIRVGGRYTSYFQAWRYYHDHLRGQTDLVIDECNTMPFFAGWYTGAPTYLLFHMLCRQIWFYEFPFPLSVVGYLAEPVYLRLLKRTPIITVSDSTKRDLTRHHLFKPSAITIIPEAVELPPVRSTAAVTKAAHPTLLILGSIRPMKRTLDAIIAFELARDHNAKLRLTIAGNADHPYGRRVLGYIKASRHATAITYAGSVPNAQKLQLLRRAHAILVTSVKEGWGLIVTEAAGQGTPAIAYNADGLRDSIQDGVTGLLTPKNTPEAMAATITALLTDKARYTKLQRAAHTAARKLTFDRTYQAFKRALGLK
jgi:glycosyltransferase involved in cell wall biosynthesis